MAIAAIGIQVDNIMRISVNAIAPLVNTVDQAIRDQYMTRLQADLSLRDHTFQDLAKMDHPYARRHGTIQAGKLGHDATDVHQHKRGLYPTIRLQPGQTAKEVEEMLLTAAERRGIPIRRSRRGGAIIDLPEGFFGAFVLIWNITTQSEITEYVATGTRTMLPRDFSGAAWTATKDDVMAQVRQRWTIRGTRA